MPLILLKYVYECFVCLYVYAHMHIVLEKVRRGQEIPWDWSYRCLGTAMCHVGVEN